MITLILALNDIINGQANVTDYIEIVLEFAITIGAVIGFLDIRPKRKKKRNTSKQDKTD